VPCALIFAAAMCSAASGAGFKQHGVHEHGKVTFNVAVEGNTVSIELDGPADNFIGFEHAPRTDAQRKAVRDMAELLESGRDLIAFTPAAGCKFTATELKAPQWQGKHGGKEEHAHADYAARFTYRCDRPGQLDWLQLRVLSKLRGVHEARVNILTSTRQGSDTVKTADARVRLK
jgi:hypothetical protein